MFHDLSIVISAETNNPILRNTAYFPDPKGNKKITGEIQGVSQVLKFIDGDNRLKPGMKVHLLHSALQLVLTCYPESDYKEKARAEIMTKLTEAKNFNGLKKFCQRSGYKFSKFKS